MPACYVHGADEPSMLLHKAQAMSGPSSGLPSHCMLQCAPMRRPAGHSLGHEAPRHFVMSPSLVMGRLGKANNWAEADWAEVS